MSDDAFWQLGYAIWAANVALFGRFFPARVFGLMGALYGLACFIWTVAA